MLLFALFVVIAAVYVYWDTQRKIYIEYQSDEMCGLSSDYVSAFSVEEATEKRKASVNLGLQGNPPKTAALKLLMPSLWNIFRLVIVPYLFKLVISKLFSFVF